MSIELTKNMEQFINNDIGFMEMINGGRETLQGKLLAVSSYDSGFYFLIYCSRTKMFHRKNATDCWINKGE